MPSGRDWSIALATAFRACEKERAAAKAVYAATKKNTCRMVVAFADDLPGSF